MAGVTYYTNPAGNDSHTGTGPAAGQAFQTLGKAISVSDPTQDSIQMVTGVYPEPLILNNFAGLVSRYFPISAFSSPVWLKPPDMSCDWAIQLDSNDFYLDFNGINLDTTNATVPDFGIGGLLVDGNNGCHHVRFRNAEILGNRLQGDLINSRVGVNWRGSGISTYNELRNVTVHGSGGDNSYYGTYIHSSNNLVDRCDYYDLGYQCFQIYDNAIPPQSNVVTNSKFHDITLGFDNRRSGAIIVGNNHILYNCLCYNIGGGDPSVTGGIGTFNGVNVQLYNCSIYGVDGPAMYTSGSGNIFRNHILFGNASNAIRVDGGTFTQTNILTSDPLWIDPANGNLHLSVFASPAVNAGATIGEPIYNLGSITPPSLLVDFDGLSRPQNTSWCVGAYEFPSSPPPVISRGSFFFFGF